MYKLFSKERPKNNQLCIVKFHKNDFPGVYRFVEYDNEVFEWYCDDIRYDCELDDYWCECPE